MNKAEVVEIAKVAVQEALAEKSKFIDSEYDARYHDVGLLLKNYRKLKTHYTKISPEVLEVNSICSLRHKTGLMMGHVDKMLMAYQAICYESADPDEIRRWEALFLRYISPERLKTDAIAEQLHIDSRTLFRDINRAKEDLSVLLFGIEAIGSWKHKRS